MDKLNDDTIKNIIMHINYNKILFLISKKINNIINIILNNNSDLCTWIVPTKINKYLIKLNNFNFNFNKLLKEYKMTNRIIAYKINNNNNIEIIGGFNFDYDITIRNKKKLILNTNCKINLLKSNSVINKWRLGNWQIYNYYCKNENEWIDNNFIKDDFIDKLHVIYCNKNDVIEKINKKNNIFLNKITINNMSIVYNSNEFELISNNIEYYLTPDKFCINNSIYFSKNSNIYIKTKTVGIIYIYYNKIKTYKLAILYENNNKILIRLITSDIKITNNNIFKLKKKIKFQCIEIYDNIIAIKVSLGNNMPGTIYFYNIITGEIIYKIDVELNEYIKIEAGSIIKIKIKNNNILIQTNLY